MGKKGGGSGGASNRAMFEVISFLIAAGVVALEMHLVFHAWWDLFGDWFDRNWLAPSLLILGLAMGPIFVFFLLKGIGKRVGGEVEDMGRGLNR